MKKLNQLCAISGVAAALACSGIHVMAQAGGQGVVLTSPARMQQQAQSLRMTLGVTNDAEWSVISPRMIKVMQLQADIRLSGLTSMARGMMGGPGRMRGFASTGTDTDPAADALTKALDDDAPVAEIKAAMAKVRQARKAKQAELTKAQSDLQSVVTIRQEAILLNNGLLD